MSLYLPNKPHVYNYCRKYGNDDLILTPFIIGNLIGAVCSIIGVFTGIIAGEILTVAIVVGISMATVLVFLLGHELINYIKYVRNNSARLNEWNNTCHTQTLEWERNNSLEFVKEVRRK